MWDLNKDGLFTISDVAILWDRLSAYAVHLFFLPGDFVLVLFFSFFPWISQFFELEPVHYYFGGWVSGILSALLWGAAGAILYQWAVPLYRLWERRFSADARVARKRKELGYFDDNEE